MLCLFGFFVWYILLTQYIKHLIKNKNTPAVCIIFFTLNLNGRNISEQNPQKCNTYIQCHTTTYEKSILYEKINNRKMKNLRSAFKAVQQM